MHRHQAGSVTAGEKSGGRFKAHERRTATLPHHVPQVDVKEELAQLQNLEALIRDRRVALHLHRIARYVYSTHPDATTMVVGRYRGEDTLRFGALERERGTQLDLSAKDEDRLETAIEAAEISPRQARMEPATGRYDILFHEVAAVNLQAARNISEPEGSLKAALA